MTTVPILGYWNIRGLGASIRYILTFLNVPFENKLYNQGQAPDFDRSEWLNEKPNLGLDFPNLPYLIDGDFKMTESAAIIKYICKKWGPHLLGSSARNTGLIEMLAA